MRLRATLFALIALIALAALAAVAYAGAPLPGNYQSTDIGGSIFPGRYSEGWAPTGGPFLAGTTQNCGSWDGATIGGQWKYTCGTQIVDAVTLLNNVNGAGYGNITKMSTFTGGVFWLDGAGPWGNGDSSYPGHFDTYVEYETVQYAAGLPIAAVTNVQSSAHFDEYPNTCLAFGIANGTRVGSTEMGNVFPGNYPALLDPTCNPTQTNGAWWNMTALTVTITPGCATPTKHSSWGAIKSYYR